jgi:predicted Zn-dependent protease
VLPFSRNHETEADKIGLTMAIAGYNPMNQLLFWSKNGSQSAGQAPPEFMSTPSDATESLT